MKLIMRLREKLKGFNSKISELENLIKSATDKVSPLREKNIENLSRIQRLNLRTSKFR